jgi:WD40 repeat protein
VPAALPKEANTPAAAAAEAAASGAGRTRPRLNRPGKPAAGSVPATAVSLVSGDELAAGRVVRLPTRNAVKHLAASADGKLLITAEDQMIRLWDCTGGNPADVAELDSQALHLGNIRAIALSPDSSMLAVGGDDKSVRLYSLANFELKKLDTQISHDSGLWTVAFSPDGKSVISGADDLNVIWWNVNNGRLEEKSRIKIPSIFGIKYLAVQPKQIVTCSTGSGDVSTIDFSGAEPVVKASYKIPPSPFCLPMAMSPADDTLLFGGGHTVQLKGASSRVFSTSTKDIKCVAWSADGKYFATGTDDGHLLVWDSTGKIRYDFIRPTRFNEIAFLAPSAHSADLVIAGANDDAEVYLLRLKPDAAAKKD